MIERKPKVGSQKDDEMGFVFPEINQQHTQKQNCPGENLSPSENLKISTVGVFQAWVSVVHSEICQIYRRTKESWTFMLTKASSLSWKL